MKVIRNYMAFISQPMNERETGIIAEERARIIESAKTFFVENCLMREDDVLVDVNPDWAEPSNASAGRLYYLGRSIQAMDKADFIIFGEGWYEASGCNIEERCAMEYFKYCLEPTPDSADYSERSLLTNHIDHIWFGKKG